MASSSLSSLPSTNSPSNASLPRTSDIFVPRLKLGGGIEPTPFRLLSSLKKNILINIAVYDAIFGIDAKRSGPALRLKASGESQGMTRKFTDNKSGRVPETEYDPHLFTDLKQRFLSFKKQKFLENVEHYQSFGRAQAPKFMVIACADSRVCPSHILGFEPGDAFIVRNVGNIVPQYEKGPSETNAALEFAVNTLEVENILVVGHSCCGGIRALMSLQDDDESSSFIRSWVINGNNARISTKAVASNLSFDQQCRYCEKESVNRSLVSLLSYPWIEKTVKKGALSIHGGYYDFVNCTFEKWTLDYKGSMAKEKTDSHSMKDREFWC